MKRDFKPGDVAIARWRHFEGARAIFSAARQQWVDIDGAEFDGDEDELTLRPLVVIDPEDREQVERLCALVKSHRAGLAVDEATIATALREFADPKPPKPDEPMAFSAAIEDADGAWWTRTGAGPRSGDWCNADGDHCDYDEIDAVKVLSEGVTA